MPADMVDRTITERSIVVGNVRYKANGWFGCQLASNEWHWCAPRHDALAECRIIDGNRKSWHIRPYTVHRIGLFRWFISWRLDEGQITNELLFAFYADIGLGRKYYD